MINVFLKNEKIEISFGGDQFRDILTYLKTNTGYKYDPDDRVWVGTATEFFKHYESLQGLDEVFVPNFDDVLLLEKREKRLETKLIDRNPSRDIFKLPPIKGKHPHEDFQLKCIRRGVRQNRLALYLQQGLGKTFITITILNQLFKDKDIERVLIVVPPVGIYNWKREIVRFSNWATEDNIMISKVDMNRDPLAQDLTNIKAIVMSYRHYLTIADDWYKKTHKNKKSTKYRKGPIPWQELGEDLCIVLDESHCFSYDKMIETEIGPLPIGYIVENKLDINILSYNHKTNVLEYKKINHYFTHNIKKSPTNIIEIGNGYSTLNHPFYTIGGYKNIGDLDGTENLFNLSKSFFTKCSQSIVLLSGLFKYSQEKEVKNKSYKKIWISQLRSVWKRNNSRSSILFSKLFSKMENESKRNSRQNIYSEENKQYSTNKKNRISKWGLQGFSGKDISSHEEKQSYDQSQNQRKNETNKIGEWGWIHQAWRKRTIHQASAIIIQRIKRSLLRFTNKFRGNSEDIKYGEEYSESLQNRYWISRFKTWYRSRWNKSSFKRKESIRRKEIKSFKQTWVECNSLYKSGYIREYTGSDDEYISVYNLEIENNNNYFVDNLLVHNCIKNTKARQSKVIQMHKQFFDYRYILTGTPTPNNFTEIYNQMNFLDEKIINNDFYGWVGEVAELGDRFSDYSIGDIYPDKQQEWENKFQDWVVRYMSDDVLDLPELLIRPMYAEMSGLQLDIYKAIVNDTIIKVKENSRGVLVPHKVRNKFAFISMSYENPLLYKEEFLHDNPNIQKLIKKFNFQKHHCKLEICDPLIEQYIKDEKRKVTILDFHPLNLDLLAERYKDLNPIVIHGNTPNDERDELLELFRTSPIHNLLLASFRVLKVAINLTECSRIIYFCRDYSYLNWSQSLKRFHRIGQADKVIIHPIIFNDSLEIYLDEVVLAGKESLDKKIFQPESFTKEMWQDIFKGKLDSIIVDKD